MPAAEPIPAFRSSSPIRSFGAQVDFNRIDVSNSSYYGFDKGRFVVARNTRYGQERAFGTPSERLIPLPERLYAGGPTSLRGFPQNAAGPRDPETGYPIGGAGALDNSTELRLPPPTLPWLGNTVSLVLFHDMGNVFTNASDAWASAMRIAPAGPRYLQGSHHAHQLPPTPTGPVDLDRLAGTVQLQLLLPRPGHRVALPYAGRAHPVRLQL